MAAEVIQLEYPEKRPIWTDAETQYFLKLLLDCHVPEHLETNKYRNAGIFQALEEPMRSAGFNRTFNQLRIKWKNLKKTYVDARRVREVGADPYSICPFYSELDMLLGNQTLRRRSEGPDREAVDISSNGSDFRGDFEEHNQEDSTMELLGHYVDNKASSLCGFKEENTSDTYPRIPQTSTGSRPQQQIREMSSLQNIDPDELFLAMILPDIKKLSAQKKRRIKMAIQKLLDEALTEEDQ